MGICVFFHELGHFLIGKWMGVKPKIFSIGYGRGILFKRKGRTIYQLTAIPLGGYVQFYGDDPSKIGAKTKKGDFFSVGPWRRMALAFGGPLFSILLGFVVVFFLVLFGWQPTTNKIHVSGENSPAYSAGLRTHDKIIAVGGITTDSYEKVSYQVAFASETEIPVKVERDGNIREFKVTVIPREQGSIPYLEGVRPAGKAYLVPASEKNLPKELKLNDKIISAGGKPIASVADLATVINEGDKKSVQLEVLRSNGGYVSTGNDEKIAITVPLKKRETLILRNLKDEQTNVVLPQKEIFSWPTNEFTRIAVNGETFTEWSAFKSALLKQKGQRKKMLIGAVEVTADATFSERKMIGISLAEGIEPEKANLPRNFISVITRSTDQTIFATKGTLVGLWRIIEGKLSFSKSVSGPVKLVAIAAKSVSSGWDTYWFLLAQISMILGIMNLLPIPVLDGGHIVFYLIEAVYKPVSFKVMAATTRIGMIIMLTMGIYVIGLDIWDVFIKKIFG